MRVYILGIALAVLFFYSCNSGESDIVMKDHAMVSFKLVDHPDSYDAILIDLVGLEYKLEAEDDEEEGEEEPEDDDSKDEGDDDDDESSRILHDKHDEDECDDDEGEWFVLDIEPQVIDILQLQNGAEALLAQSEIPAGELKELRLILGENNKIVVAGDTMDLFVPSGTSSGIKIKVHSEIEAGEFYDVVIDFVASKSIVKRGNGKYLLKPVVKAKLVHDDDPYGGISGVVAPADLYTMVHAINAEDDTASTEPGEDGAYLIDLLLPGSYTVVVEPADTSGFDDFTIENVEVLEEQITELDSVKFE